eukprot:768489-Hanusia_phi.AAC.2
MSRSRYAHGSFSLPANQSQVLDRRLRSCRSIAYRIFCRCALELSPDESKSPNASAQCELLALDHSATVCRQTSVTVTCGIIQSGRSWEKRNMLDPPRAAAAIVFLLSFNLSRIMPIWLRKNFSSNGCKLRSFGMLKLRTW